MTVASFDVNPLDFFLASSTRSPFDDEQKLEEGKNREKKDTFHHPLELTQTRGALSRIFERPNRIRSQSLRPNQYITQFYGNIVMIVESFGGLLNFFFHTFINSGVWCIRRDVGRIGA